ncbi:MAG: phosphatase PAP2 family protein [Lachnospiraceae bacterium]|nr:phosphatase PAP2 family protein [Lachnospiraceae bacterium]
MDGSVFFMEWEESFIAWLQQLGGEGGFKTFLVWLNNFFSFLGEEYFAVMVMGIVYWGIDKKKGERIGFAVVASLVGNTLIKNKFRRIRPWASSDKINLLREVDGYSFPSAHSSSATALYPTLAAEYKSKKWLRIPAILIPVLIAFSRCYLGAHWPTDVLCGLLLGLLFFALSEFVLKRIDNKYILYIIVGVIGVLGMFYCTTDDYFSNYGIYIGFCSGMLFDDKVVRFENTKSVPLIAIRTLCGGLIFFALNSLVKLLIGGIFPEDTFGFLLLRTVRYAIVVFLILGVYPALFKPVEGFFRKKFLKKVN